MMFTTLSTFKKILYTWKKSNNNEYTTTTNNNNTNFIFKKEIFIKKNVGVSEGRFGSQPKSIKCACRCCRTLQKTTNTE